jgi:hypothetical protein
MGHQQITSYKELTSDPKVRLIQSEVLQSSIDSSAKLRHPLFINYDKCKYGINKGAKLLFQSSNMMKVIDKIYSCKF